MVAQSPTPNQKLYSRYHQMHGKIDSAPTLCCGCHKRPDCCINSHTPPKEFCNEIFTTDWWWEIHVRPDTREWYPPNRCRNHAQYWGYTGSFDRPIRVNRSLEYCWPQERLTCTLDNWQSIIDDLLDASSSQRENCHTPTDCNLQP